MPNIHSRKLNRNLYSHNHSNTKARKRTSAKRNSLAKVCFVRRTKRGDKMQAQAAIDLNTYRNQALIVPREVGEKILSMPPMSKETRERIRKHAEMIKKYNFGEDE